MLLSLCPTLAAHLEPLQVWRPTLLHLQAPGDVWGWWEGGNCESQWLQEGSDQAEHFTYKSPLIYTANISAIILISHMTKYRHGEVRATSLSKVRELTNAADQHQDLASFRLGVRIQKGWHGEGEADIGKNSRKPTKRGEIWIFLIFFHLPSIQLHIWLTFIFFNK